MQDRWGSRSAAQEDRRGVRRECAVAPQQGAGRDHDGCKAPAVRAGWSYDLRHLRHVWMISESSAELGGSADKQLDITCLWVQPAYRTVMDIVVRAMSVTVFTVFPAGECFPLLVRSELGTSSQLHPPWLLLAPAPLLFSRELTHARTQQVLREPSASTGRAASSCRPRHPQVIEILLLSPRSWPGHSTDHEWSGLAEADNPFHLKLWTGRYGGHALGPMVFAENSRLQHGVGLH